MSVLLCTAALLVGPLAVLARQKDTLQHAIQPQVQSSSTTFLADAQLHLMPCTEGTVGQQWDLIETTAYSLVSLRSQEMCVTCAWCRRGALILSADCSRESGNNQLNFTLTSDGLLFNQQHNLCATPPTADPYTTMFSDFCENALAFEYSAETGQLTLAQNKSLCLDIGTPIPTCNPKLDYCNPDLDINTRTEDLLSRMTLREKAFFLNTDPVGISRLLVPPIQFGEGLHGVLSKCGAPFSPTNSTGCPTSFPHHLLTSCSFNRTLWNAMGNVVATEARSLYNQHTKMAGILLWTPDINLFRDPRWGRGQEVPGEDPFLTAEFVAQWSHGMQFGNDSRFLRVVSTAKHFFAYDLEGNHGVDRQNFNAIVTDQDLAEYYFPAFQSAVANAKIQSIMCSYNSVNGIPSCANDFMQNFLLRDQWGFEGFIVSDCDSISDGAFSTYIREHYNGSSQWQIEQGIANGCDINCGQIYSANIEDAVHSGILDENVLDLAISRVFHAMYRLGYLSPNVSYADVNSYGPAQVDTPQSRKLALEAAEQSIILLKNSLNFLPLATPLKIGLVGPHFNATQALLSTYVGTMGEVISPYNAISSRIGVEKTLFAQGCIDTNCETDTNGNQTFDEAVEVAKNSDVVVVFVGLSPGPGASGEAREDEGWDRDSLSLPGLQEALIQKVFGANQNTVVVLIHAGPLAVQWTKDNVPAIIDAHYPGERGGDAIASILFGDVSPSGRLSSTVYPADFVNARDISDMNLRDKGGVTYMFYQGTPLWEFGFGLSYTTFVFEPVVKKATLTTDHFLRGSPVESEAFSVRVTNTGTVSSDCVVLAFVNTTGIVEDGPFKKLFNFTRIRLDPLQSQVVSFAMSPQVFAVANNEGAKTVEAGEYQIIFGVDGAAEQRAAYSFVEIVGSRALVSKSMKQLRRDYLATKH